MLNQLPDRLYAYHGIFRAALHASRRRSAVLFAQLPIQPHRQLPRDGHFRHRRAATERAVSAKRWTLTMNRIGGGPRPTAPALTPMTRTPTLKIRVLLWGKVQVWRWSKALTAYGLMTAEV